MLKIIECIFFTQIAIQIKKVVSMSLSLLVFGQLIRSFIYFIIATNYRLYDLEGAINLGD